MSRTKIYTASKVFRAPMWQALRIDYPDLEFTSSWIDMKIGPVEEANDEQCRLGWIQNIRDVGNSDHLVCYAEKDDALSGTLVEVGAMLMRAHVSMSRKQKVYLIGDCERFQTWKHHPSVVICNSTPLAPQFRIAVVLDRITKFGE